MTLAQRSDAPLWHLLQVSDVLDLEFATALAALVPLIAWEPQRSFRALNLPPGAERERITPDSPLRLRTLPLLRGSNRFPFSLLGSFGPSILDRLLAQTPQPESSPLICTVPYFASVAEAWPGPVVYWLTDLIAEYSSANRAQVVELDRRICRVATLLCPNSERLRQYLVQSVGCDPARIQIVPNATRSVNILPAPPKVQAEEHSALHGIPRPIAGVIGNLAGNTDWLLLQKLMALVPEFSWVFVGPTSMTIDDREQRDGRRAVMRHSSAHFLGPKPYRELASYARAFDVAVLPYKRCEPTYSGSSTRFYEHLAACRPMIATSGLYELTRQPPLLQITDTAERASEVLLDLASRDFNDGLLDLRWRTSRVNTWRQRAQAVQQALARRLEQKQMAS